MNLIPLSDDCVVLKQQKVELHS